MIIFGRAQRIKIKTRMSFLFMDLQSSINSNARFFTIIKRSFFQKVAFYICEESARLSYGALEVHKQKAHARFEAIRWALPKITKLPLINHQFSCYPSFLSSHLSALPTNFQIPHKKIYNKFSNQLTKKKNLSLAN